MMLKPSTMNGIDENVHLRKIRCNRRFLAHPASFDGYKLKTFHGLKWHFWRKKRKYNSSVAAKKSGDFRNYIKDEKDVSFKDFSNPFTFCNLVFKETHTFICWLQDKGLLRRNVICKNCRNEMTITAREGNMMGLLFVVRKDMNTLFASIRSFKVVTT